MAREKGATAPPLFCYYIFSTASMARVSRCSSSMRRTSAISHSHEDHFNPEVFSFCREHPNVRYVVSYDIPKSILSDCGIVDPIIAEPGMDIRPESRFRLKVLPSTDLGVAYLAGCMGRNIGATTAGWNSSGRKSN